MNSVPPSSEGSFQHLIKERIKNFWGYGNLSSDVWFVGMEEGCDGSVANLIKRFQSTAYAEVVDIHDDMKDSEEHMQWFRKGAPTQATYRKLIYLLLYFKNKKEPTIEDIREYQINYFGRAQSNHALLELMPLPARSLQAKDWVYASSGVEGLSSRRVYLRVYKPKRIIRLRELVEKYKPKIVICYSMVYLNDWRDITNASFVEVIPKKLYKAKDDHTVYAVVPHSVAHGMSNNDWSKIATIIYQDGTS